MPEGWAWCRLRNIGEYKKGPFGSSLTKSMFVPKSEKTVKVYEQKNAIQKDHTLGEYYITRDYFESQMQGFEVFPGDILVSCAGTIGETYILPDNIEQGIINQALMKMKITSLINIDYFLMFFDHILKEESANNGKGTAIKNIPPFDIFKNFLFPLPSYSEQKRIIESVNNIFSIIDNLENNKSDLRSLIKSTKSKILDLAIHGKLVLQDPNDEPAEELLKRIATSDNRPYEKVEEEPFEIPASWRWALLKNVGIKTDTGYPFDSTKFTTESKNRNAIIRIRDIVRGFSETFSDEVCPDSYVVNTGEILIGMDGDFNIAKWKSKPALLNQRVCRIKKSINEINLDYFFYLLPIPLLEINKSTSSVTVKHLSNKQIENMLFPIPPVLEQDRIVKTIEEFFSRLDQIQNNLV